MERKIYSVSQINRYIKGVLEDDYILSGMWVRGEISNYKKHTTGHIYFTLKDRNGSVDCVMFKDYASMMPYEPQNGMTAVVYGNVSVYERAGKYNLYAQIIDLEGEGDLNALFEKLKRELSAEGLFDPDYKREIEKRPETIAVITSPTGAAVRDIIQVARRRNKGVKIVVCPALVQGDNAADSIVEALSTVNRWGKADTIILGRGGGSKEDLWPFNEEKVARAIFASKIPVISAVGHETDFSISDFAADLRAPTPSAAAELAVNSVSEDIDSFYAYKSRFNNAFAVYFRQRRMSLALAESRGALRDPHRVFKDIRKRLDEKNNDINILINNKINEKAHRYDIALNTLEALSPLAVLKRGYSLTYFNGRLIKDVREVKETDEVKIRLDNGNIYAAVKGTDLNG